MQEIAFLEGRLREPFEGEKRKGAMAGAMAESDVVALRTLGFSDVEIATQVIAHFNQLHQLHRRRAQRGS